MQFNITDEQLRDMGLSHDATGQQFIEAIAALGPGTVKATPRTPGTPPDQASAPSLDALTDAQLLTMVMSAGAGPAAAESAGSTTPPEPDDDALAAFAAGLGVTVEDLRG